MEQFGLTEAEMHFGLSQADLLKFRKSAWLGPIWIGLAQADLDRLILMNTLQAMGSEFIISFQRRYSDYVLSTEKEKRIKDYFEIYHWSQHNDHLQNYLPNILICSRSNLWLRTLVVLEVVVVLLHPLPLQRRAPRPLAEARAEAAVLLGDI